MELLNAPSSQKLCVHFWNLVNMSTSQQWQWNPGRGIKQICNSQGKLWPLFTPSSYTQMAQLLHSVGGRTLTDKPVGFQRLQPCSDFVSYYAINQLQACYIKWMMSNYNGRKVKPRRRATVEVRRGGKGQRFLKAQVCLEPYVNQIGRPLCKSLI